VLASLIAWAQPALAVAFTAFGTPVTWLEVVAFVLSLWMVGCNMRVHWFGWPLGIVASALYALLFLASRLYGEASLQVFFAVVGGWGWWQWLRGHDAQGHALVVHRMSRRLVAGVGLATLAGWPLLALLLRRYTDSDVPFLDGLSTAGSIAGQFLLGRKFLENWLVWLAVNVFSVALFAVKGLWLTVLLYAIFAVLSVAGWRAWRALEGRRDAASAHAAERAPAGAAAAG
jgi:nicotinamide mononucleotide transporter